MLPDNVKDIHFIGIGGYGMSALAHVLLEKGYGVSGSDIRESAITGMLKEKGAIVHISHHAENLGKTQLVIYSTAITPDNPELLAAKEKEITVWHRSDLLAVLINNCYGIAVAGAHGKTTTTAMVSLLLEAGGLDPTSIIGGFVPLHGSNARIGKSQYLVAEADESDSSFVRYYPHMAIVTGIEADHLEHYGNEYENLHKAYSVFLSQVSAGGTAVICAEDDELRNLASHLECKVIYYALNDDPRVRPDYCAANIAIEGLGSKFDLYHRGKLCAEGVRISIPGNHNISNAVAAFALIAQLGLDPASYTYALKDFKGVGRRFEVIGMGKGVTVIDDYAHHPTEIKATLEAARPRTEGKIICLFQPHRYSRTAYFIREYTTAFNSADILLLHSVYSAGEKPIPGATSEALADRINTEGSVTVIQDDDISNLEKEAVFKANPGDLIITMGAGDINYSAPRIVKMLSSEI